MNKNTLLNNYGMSLVSVMVAIGLTGVLSLLIMKNMEVQSKSSKTAEYQNQINDMKRLFSDFVSREEPCNASFGSYKGGESINFLRLKDDPSYPYYAARDEEFQKSGLIIKDMHLLTLAEQKQRSLNLTTIGANGIGQTYLSVTVEKKNKGNIFGGGRTTFLVDIIADFSLESYPSENITEEQALRDFVATANVENVKVQAEMTAAGLTAAERLVVGEVRPFGFKTFDEMDPDKNEDAVKDLKEFVEENKAKPFFMGEFIDSTYGVWLLWPIMHPTYKISDCGSHLSRQ